MDKLRLYYSFWYTEQENLVGFYLKNYSSVFKASPKTSPIVKPVDSSGSS